MRVFASCSSYSLGVLTTSGEACALLTNAVRDLEHEQLVPAVHALRELRYLAEVELRIDGGATHISKTRSRHFAAALESACDVWLTIDDDVDTTRETLAALLAAVDDMSEPLVCFAPYVQRNDTTLAAVGFPPVYQERDVRGRDLATLGRVRRATKGPFGLVTVNRKALETIAALVPMFKDDDGVMKPAAFLEVLTADGQWLGEDFSFFSRVAGHVTVEALITGETTHAGNRLDLSTLR